jgi:transposase
MSRMANATKSRRPRRRFDDEFKAQAVRLVLDEGKTVGAVARELDLTESALREWVKRALADRTHGRTGLTTAEREALARLRKENRERRTEREILKNSARAKGGPTCGPETPESTLTGPGLWPSAFW